MTTNNSIWPLIRDTKVPEGAVHIWWLLQAGFVIKSPGGFTVCIDAYLTDSVQTSYGISRGYPAPLTADESEFDVVLATHPHDDHQDPETIIPFSKHPKTRYMGPFSVIKLARAGGFYGDRGQVLKRREIGQVGDITIEAVYARHMFELEETPDAAGYIVTVGKHRIYHSGDTEYDARIVDDTEGRVDVSLICINGVTGNMDTKEAAFLAWRQGCKVAVPMHWGLWPADMEMDPPQTLDLDEFTDTYQRLEPNGTVWIPRIGEPLELR
ncbi:MAG: MBL fold metallo-hydrolase [Actinobacteria bacterium]|nr:MBL fold metallo-hydrolase [Actinomycetota bacterium]